MKRSFVFLISIFFFWGFVAASNDILIPVFKEALNLTQWQSQMIAFAFYVAYTVGALIYIGLTRLLKTDLATLLGYGKALSVGLLVSACGTLLFIPAANLASFPLLLLGLIVVGLGFSLQQTVANPVAISLGNAATGSQRLSLAGGINNIGTTLGPLLVSFAIFGVPDLEKTATLSIASVKFPYLFLGLFFCLFAIVFWRLDLGSPVKTNTSTGDIKQNSDINIYKIPQVWLGMIAIFLYVGVEVATASNLPEYLTAFHQIETSQLAPYISLFWASLMIGRWASASGALNLKGLHRQLFRWFLPFAAFALFLFVNWIAGYDVFRFLPYLFAVLILIVADTLTKGNPAIQLLVYSLLGALALVLGMALNGEWAIFSFLAAGLFCSTLWPCIFTLAISGMNEHTSKVSNALIMMIMGGGFVSVFQGWLASPHLIGIRFSYIVGVCCFAFLAYYASFMLKKSVAAK